MKRFFCKFLAISLLCGLPGGTGWFQGSTPGAIKGSIFSSSAVFALDSLDYELAINLYRAGELKKSMKAIEKIEKANGMNAEMCLLKYEILKRKEKLKEAKECLISALRYDENCYEAYIALAIMEINNKNANAAKGYFAKAIDLCPELAYSADILYYYAKICIIDKDFETALENILFAIELDENDPAYYLELGKIYLYKNDYLRAVNALEYAISQGVENLAECYNYLGLANYKRGNFSTALDYFEKAIDKEPVNMVFLNNITLCYKSLEDNENYKKTLDKLYSLTPVTAEDFLQAAQILYSKGSIEEAKKAITSGLLKFPDDLSLKETQNMLNKL